MIAGSPDWFHKEAKNEKHQATLEYVEGMREWFLDHFAPEKLAEMGGEELLKDVFGDGEHSMIRLLMYDGEYRWFGAPGEYKYLYIVYQKNDGEWAYKEGVNAQIITRDTALEKAIHIRDQLLYCIGEIEKIGNFASLYQYQVLDDAISDIFFSKYSWVLKYYQMVFPQYFPGMYADNTILRAIHILGLPSHGKTKRLLNAGEISLFIRRCDVNNIVFNEIYADRWGWVTKQNPCENAHENYEYSKKILGDANLKYYHFGDDKKKRLEEASQIDKEIETLQLHGKEKDAIVKVRVNQSTFRKRLIHRYGKCCLCGVSEERLLVASHIKPWSESAAEEKIDTNNGFLFCPNHDRLFDQGFISFSDDGSIMISKHLNEINRLYMNVKEGEHIILTEENKAYLAFHRLNKYRS